MVSLNTFEKNCVSSPSRAAAMSSTDYKYSKHQGFRKFRGNTSVDETQHFLSSVLYSKAKDKYTRGKTKNFTQTLKECPPVQGREHLSVQTDNYLEELVDKTDEIDQGCQTDRLLDRPASPLFIPVSSGTDVGTQICPDDLLNVDLQVEPFLNRVVNETIEQSMVELSEKDRLTYLEDQREESSIHHKAEETEYLNFQDGEERKHGEKQTKAKERTEANLLEEEMTKKVAACVFAQDYLSGLLPRVYRRLERQGYFITQESEIQDAELNFWPWLMDEVDTDIQTLQASCNLIDALIEDSVSRASTESVIKPTSDTQDKVDAEVVNKENQEKEDQNADNETAANNDVENHEIEE